MARKQPLESFQLYKRNAGQFYVLEKCGCFLYYTQFYTVYIQYVCYHAICYHDIFITECLTIHHIRKPSSPSTTTTHLINCIMPLLPQKVTELVHKSRWSCPTASSLTGLTYPSPYASNLKCWMSIVRNILEKLNFVLKILSFFLKILQPIS